MKTTVHENPLIFAFESCTNPVKGHYESVYLQFEPSATSKNTVKRDRLHESHSFAVVLLAVTIKFWKCTLECEIVQMVLVITRTCHCCSLNYTV